MADLKDQGNREGDLLVLSRPTHVKLISLVTGSTQKNSFLLRDTAVRLQGGWQEGVVVKGMFPPIVRGKLFLVRIDTLLNSSEIVAVGLEDI